MEQVFTNPSVKIDDFRKFLSFDLLRAMKRFHFGKRDKRDEPISPRTLESLVSMPSSCSTATDDGAGPNTHNVSVIDTDSRGTPIIPMSEKPSNLQVFTLAELKSATKNFSPSDLVGEGGFGYVFKGSIKNSEDPSQRVKVAVKQLGIRRMQGHKEWVTEVNFLGVVEHPNLVKLVGYCAEDNERGTQRLLVYEFMPNGSLDQYLSRRSRTVLPWTLRLKIALDAARGLKYLHEEMDFQIIVRDFKSSNILLDENWNAKLSDFGLARLGPPEGFTHVSTTVVGTVGYAAPEYVQSGHVSAKSDVWSYGVFLFELITGRRSMDRHGPKGQQGLSEWVTPYLYGNFGRMLDPGLNLHGKCTLESVQKLARIATLCLVDNPRCRPKMSEVFEMVTKIVEESTETGSPQLPLRSWTSMETSLDNKTNNGKTSMESKTGESNSYSFPTSQKPSNLQLFAIAELKSATKNFSRSVLVSECGFGRVYKGLIKNSDDPSQKVEVAVKQLGRRGMQGHKEWVTEVNFLGAVEHPNLVKLVGYCPEDDERQTQLLLVYEFMPNGSVHQHLSRRSETTLLWTMRLKIAQDTARGLEYLHEEMDFQIILRDFKSSNILLDENWNAKLSNFALARLGPAEVFTHVSTEVVRSLGYAAPEYVQTGQLAASSDVWSYGIFLCELITGRGPVDRNRPKSEQKLLEWVKPYLSDAKKIQQILDPRLEGKYSLNSVHKLATIANRCLVTNPNLRPKMSEVLEMVTEIIEGSTETGSPQLPLRNSKSMETSRDSKTKRNQKLGKVIG
ncbi:LOW QUALITY PROTEIN: serine/threonine-protein kinase PCRK2-like [Pistacia vera]|uniref:LOW QUALITY PROTEIN: serine/threonine-protein kinase PCRK2-like n=1 Tax=Pistacia vera TaxID=55513 RepID=UPI001263D042|nr:LOW QUALITY PROTEIN: serine/threonine-protein kinase PCRK2-like [Pistacia vera]